MTTSSHDIEELERRLLSVTAENARLRGELAISRDRQNARAEILRTIAASPSDARPVFAAIASSSKRLLGGFSATVLQFIGDELHLVAFTPTSPEADDGLKASFPRKIADFPTFALRARRRDDPVSRQRGGRRPRAEPGAGATARLPQRAVHAADEPRHAGRHDQRHARRNRRVRARPRAAAPDLCRSGRDRHRECAPVQRDQGNARAPDRDGPTS